METFKRRQGGYGRVVVRKIESDQVAFYFGRSPREDRGLPLPWMSSTKTTRNG